MKKAVSRLLALIAALGGTLFLAACGEAEAPACIPYTVDESAVEVTVHIGGNDYPVAFDWQGFNMTDLSWERERPIPADEELITVPRGSEVGVTFWIPHNEHIYVDWQLGRDLLTGCARDGETNEPARTSDCTNAVETMSIRGAHDGRPGSLLFFRFVTDESMLPMMTEDYLRVSLYAEWGYDSDYVELQSSIFRMDLWFDLLLV